MNKVWDVYFFDVRVYDEINKIFLKVVSYFVFIFNLFYREIIKIKVGVLEGGNKKGRKGKKGYS